jgi:hypothetical protein
MKPDFALLFWILSVMFSFWSLGTGELMPLAIGLLFAIVGILIERRPYVVRD